MLIHIVGYGRSESLFALNKLVIKVVKLGEALKHGHKLVVVTLTLYLFMILGIEFVRTAAGTD